MAKTNSSERQMTVNIIASLLSFAVTMGINFFLTPVLTERLGTEAYRFIGLSHNFVSYATVITAALNSMSGRFISIAYHRGDKEKASKYFSSVLVADLIIAGAMLVVTSVLTLYIDKILDVPTYLVRDVKITFAITFLTFVISVITAIFTTATYVKNRIDINSVRDIASNLIKASVVVALFTFFPTELYFLALAALTSGVFLLITNISVKKKILPDVEISFKKFRFDLVKTLIAAGVWMSLAQLSTVLLSGLDLLICNLTLGSALMGILSVAKTVPNCFATLISMLANIFTPHYTILYANNDIDGLVGEVKFTSKLTSLILNVPIAGFIAFGFSFYTLWQPKYSREEILMIQILSVLTCVQYLFSAQSQCLIQLNSVCNKMKLPVLLTLGMGLLSTLIVLVVLGVFDSGDRGVYVIAGVSSILMSLKAVVFAPIYSAYLLKQKKRVFFSPILRGFLAFAVISVLFMIINSLVSINSWLTMIVVCAAAGVFGYILSIPLLFNKSEMLTLKRKILKK